jgi:YVTN family beta-propeller protein
METALRCVNQFGRLHYLFLLVLLISASSLGANTVFIYVTDSAADTVEVIDPVTNTVVQVIQGIEVPHGVNFSKDGTRVYISNESQHELDIVDQKLGKIISRVPLSGRPNNIAVTKDGKKVLVCIRNETSGLDIVDLTDLKVVKTIPAKGGLHNVYVTPDGRFAVGGSTNGRTLTVIDLQTEQPIWEIPFENGVRPMAFETNPDGSTSRIFVQISRLSGFSVVDFATRKEVTRVNLPDEPNNGVVIPTTPSHGIAVAPDQKTLWVNSTRASSVFVYSLPDLKLIGHVPTGEVPDWLSFTPDGKTIYVSNSGAMSVSAIDTTSRKEIARIPVGEVPKRSNTLVLP